MKVRYIVYMSLVAALLLTALPRGTAAAPAEQGRSRTFPETGQTVSGRILETWESVGDYATSLYINGLPLTDKRAEVNFDDGKTYPTQWFERARFEEHAENKAPYDVLLGRLGAFAAEGRTDTPFVGINKPTGANIEWFAETKHSIRGAIRDYFIKYGGGSVSGGIRQFGFPLSEEFMEASKDVPGKSFTVQYFERQRFELHPENKAPFDVLLGRLGAEQMGQSTVVREAIAPETGTVVDQLRIGMSQEPDSLYSVTTNLAVSTNVLAAIERQLVHTNGDGERYAEVAAFVPTVDNGGAYYVGEGAQKRLVVKYKLRRGVKWSDGKEATSSDVIYGYTVLLHPDTQVADRSGLQKVKEIKNPDAYTLIYNYLTATEAGELYRRDPDTYGSLKDFADKGQPVVDPTYFFVGNTLYPEHVYGKFAPGELESRVGRSPVGVGPYKLSRWEAGQFIELVVNDNYSIRPTKPRIPRLRYNIVTDSNALLAQTQAGGHDVITSDALSLAQSPTLDKLAGKKVDYIPALVWEHLELNTSRPILSDKRVRQAVAYGINRQQIVDQLLFGKTAVLHGWLTPGYNWSCDNTKFADSAAGAKCKTMTRYNFDQAKARQLLDQAGWAVGSDGIRAKGGQRLVLDWWTTNSQIRQDTTLAFKQDLAAIGIELKPTYVRAAAELFGSSGAVALGNYDVAEFAYLSDVDPGGFSLWHSSNIPTEANEYGGQNNTRFKNERADDVITLANNSISDAERAPLYAEHQAIVAEEVPFIGLYTRPNITVSPSGLKNWKPSGSLVPPTWNVEEWYLAK